MHGGKDGGERKEEAPSRQGREAEVRGQSSGVKRTLGANRVCGVEMKKKDRKCVSWVRMRKGQERTHTHTNH